MAALMRRSLFTASRALLANVKVVVPGMGDSITEGSLIKLVAPLGSYVKQDDIVCVIETDKVRKGVEGRHGWRSNSAKRHAGLHPNRRLTPHSRSPHTLPFPGGAAGQRGRALAARGVPQGLPRGPE